MATNIGKRIMERRQQLGLTQEELAFRMGYKTKSAINKIELGVNDVSQSKVVKFAEALNTTIAYLMGWSEEEKKATEKVTLSDGQKQLMEFVATVPEDKAEMILRVMKSIVEAD